jgi:hypothetical protein
MPRVSFNPRDGDHDPCGVRHRRLAVKAALAFVFVYALTRTVRRKRLATIPARPLGIQPLTERSSARSSTQSRLRSGELEQNSPLLPGFNLEVPLTEEIATMRGG